MADKLISTEDLKKKAYPFPCAIGVEYAVPLRAINEASEAVVRCKECRYSIYDPSNNSYECLYSADWDDELNMPIGFTSYHDADFFCAYGERSHVEYETDTV